MLEEPPAIVLPATRLLWTCDPTLRPSTPGDWPPPRGQPGGPLLSLSSAARARHWGDVAKVQQKQVRSFVCTELTLGREDKP